LARACVSVAARIEDITAIGERERAARVLLDHHDRDPESADLTELVEHEINRDGR
jgi:hypothetical protein